MYVDQAGFPSEDIEGALLAHPNVTAAAAFAWRNAEEVIAAAAVTTNATVAFSELVAFCREQIPEHIIPEFILFLPEMPRDQCGRIRKEKIGNILLADPPPGAAEPASSSGSVAWKPGEHVYLETPNYMIRSLVPADVSDRLLDWWADPEIVVPLKIRAARYSRESFVRFLNGIDNIDHFFLGVFVRETGLHIGWWKIDFDPRSRVVTLDFAIGDKSFQGRRIIDEMRDVVDEFLFLGLGVYRVEAKIYVDNIRSRRLAERSGYRLEAIFACDEQSTDGVCRDIAFYRLYGSEWRERRDGQGANP